MFFSDFDKLKKFYLICLTFGISLIYLNSAQVSLPAPGENLTEAEVRSLFAYRLCYRFSFYHSRVLRPSRIILFRFFFSSAKSLNGLFLSRKMYYKWKKEFNLIRDKERTVYFFEKALLDQKKLDSYYVEYTDDGVKIW